MSEIERRGEQVIVKPGQDLVASMTPEFRKELRVLLDEGCRDLVIDLVDTEMIDSVGLGALIAAYNSLSKKGGKLSVINASANIHGLFKTTRLDKHFNVTNA
ncbi:MAG: STAS domain-containing protein [Acidobacteriota bacterium]